MRFGGWHITGAPQKRAQVSLRETFVLSSSGVLREHSMAWPRLVLLWDFWPKSSHRSLFPARWSVSSLRQGTEFGLLLLMSFCSLGHAFRVVTQFVLGNDCWCFSLWRTKLSKKTFEYRETYRRPDAGFSERHFPSVLSSVLALTLNVWGLGSTVRPTVTKLGSCHTC